ncbi:MAG: hypothetical protein WCA35_06860 [Kovacikia sp.]
MHLVNCDPKTVEQTLAAAQQKLLATDGPMMLRMVSFLRISCSLLEEKGAYSSLMKQLFQCDAQWWASCVITSDGLVKSNNPDIQNLLLPVLSLYQATDLPFAA